MCPVKYYLEFNPRWRDDESQAANIKTAVRAWEECGKSLKNIKTLLQILCTLPVTTMEAERLFSKVKNTLTAARSTMTENRLESLIMLQVYRNMLPTTDEVLERFLKKDRKMRLLHTT